MNSDIYFVGGVFGISSVFNDLCQDAALLSARALTSIVISRSSSSVLSERDRAQQSQCGLT
jgi:hypothetical protein